MYTKVVVTQERGTCLLCVQPLAAGDLCFLVPSSCGEAEKMEAGKPYKGVLMHRRCVAGVP
jgi:hypothetical protein